MIWIYRLFFLPALILASPVYLRRMFRRGGYGEDFGEHFGRVKPLPSKRDGVKRIWLQAVSVGELVAVGPLLRALAARGDNEVYLTTTTSTGYALAREKYGALTIAIGYFPLDFWTFNARTWSRVDPDLVLLAEAEAWPEHVRRARSRGVPIVLVNARLSDRSFRRYSRVRALARALFRNVSVILPSSEEDARRFAALGIPGAKLKPSGNLKFDVAIPSMSPAERDALRASLGFHAGTRILLGSSTWPGEEGALLDWLGDATGTASRWRLLIVPRHAERRGEIEKLLEGRRVKWHLRSRGPVPADGVDVLVADTTGELQNLTQLADLVFVGKSIPPNDGGQTPIEAASLGKPLLFGPNMSNFRYAASSLVACGAAEIVADGAALGAAVQRLMSDDGARERMAAAAARLHQENQGATARTLEKIAEFLKA